MTRLARTLPAVFAATGAAALIAPLLVPPLEAGPCAARIEWASSLADARAAAAAAGKVLFVAINMDGEHANDTLAEEVYRDKLIVALAAETVNLVASAADHGKGDCPRFPGVTCAAHRDVDVKVRHEVLGLGTGPVVAPQHVFLAPDGKVLLSVPYEVRAGELEWCFHEARRLVDPQYAAKPSAKSQKPQRLVVGGIDQDAAEGPIPRARALELIAELRKGTGKHHELIYELARADEPEAQDEIEQFLRQGPMMGADGSIGTDWRPPLVRWIGDVSPASYWRLLEGFVGAGELALRKEAIVAMEQLAAPEGLDALLKQLRKEKEALQTAGLLRAIGACGVKDPKARAALLKATKEKDALIRRSALVALGRLEPNPEVAAKLTEALASGDDVDRAAAAVAMGLTRDPRWVPALEPLCAEGTPAPDVVRAAAAAALEVVRGAPYSRLLGDLRRVADDEMPRARLFGA